ncbi:Cse1-domain-containing protein [Kockovaella imperatae]|uniref:Cse1-domain-containing protein n=1 Tax=Kockovaella imperatae TaxID=4999 RepID=A0A1Y1UG27_9TREE|nr:Cse1-domain-containing protein [Kockovaella imperatae]ORX36025.1 Cse1-domain-containing protein [Kockovaella imperatae]
MASSDTLRALSQALSSTVVSHDAATRRLAEESLRQGESQPGFLVLLLQLVRSDDVDMIVRQAGGVYFKNAVKRLWEGEETDVMISPEDKAAIKQQLVPIMIALGSPATAKLQAQIGEGLAIIAEKDFPEQWEGLVDELVGSLSPDNFVINNGVLATAHSIFKRWRAQFRSDKLYSEINFVLARFCQPYYELFAHVDRLLSAPAGQPLPAGSSIPLLAQSLLLLIQLFHDLSSQDLPPFFEENMGSFMGEQGGREGWLRKYLSWEREELKGDDEDETPGPLQKIRSSICEIAELYALKYSDAFNQLGTFVDGVWNMLTTLGPGAKEDVLVSRALKFLSVVVKMGDHRDMFSSPATLNMFCERIILPNMTLRQNEEEMFEDDPMEYIRRDLEPSTESDTRRQAATDFTRALMEHFDQQVTQIINGYITSFLQEYATNPAEKWKSKDTAIYLLTSIASRGSTQQLGVTSTNVLVDVVNFFGQNIFADLQAASGTVHPILTVDAIKFLYTFRNQLTKDQLVSVLPLLVQHLASDNYVVSSYAAITIERILFIKVNRQAQFTQSDVRPFAENILMTLFANIERGATPEKISENDYLMKCAMRVIITARQALTPVYANVLSRLVNILGEISKNPSNPKFNQYCFESVSALIKFVCEGAPSALPHFEQALFGPAQVILAQDVTEFIPYIFQILAQLLELHPPTELPNEYQALLAPLLSASLWEQRGNIPALARIWKALLMRGAPLIASNGQVQGLLGIFQRLVNSKVNDVYAFELLQGLFEFLPLNDMRQYANTIFMLLLTRLQSKPSSQFTASFVHLFTFLCAIQSVGPDFVIQTLDAIQAGLFGNILTGVILANTQKAPIRYRKVVEVGLTKLLTQSDATLASPNQQHWPSVLLALLDLFTLPQDITYTNGDGAQEDLSSLDPEEASFQSSFSRLGASESATHDPVSDVKDEKLFASKEISRRSKERPGVIPALVQQAQATEAKTVGDFVSYMRDNGDEIV